LAIASAKGNGRKEEEVAVESAATAEEEAAGVYWPRGEEHLTCPCAGQAGALTALPDATRRSHLLRQKQRQDFLRRMGEVDAGGEGGRGADSPGGERGWAGGGDRGAGARGGGGAGAEVTFEEIEEIFRLLDKDSDGCITHAELIIGLRRHQWVAQKLGMPTRSVCGSLCSGGERAGERATYRRDWFSISRYF